MSLSAAVAAEPSTASSPTTPERRATATTTVETKLSHSDKSFLEKAAKDGMKEVDISQTTMDRLTNPQVRDFAKMMATDHAAANKELMALAARKGVTLAINETKWTEKWSKKTKDLDEDYIKEMVDDHEDAVSLFRKAAKSDDAEIAAFAQKTLPTLEQHLMTAKTLKKMVK